MTTYNRASRTQSTNFNQITVRNDDTIVERNKTKKCIERELRKRISALPFVDLRIGCEVLDRIEEEAGVIVKYNDEQGNVHSIRTSYLVGADGKRGVVRKKFLEREGIRQEVGLYNHVSTWVAANFEISLPTPATHPDFPLWKVGYSPEQVYDAFWPSGFQ
jgi:2-polyprenyl-6-methoxyphenol hydroxylase-like FAD-dependent oxidoreductase